MFKQTGQLSEAASSVNKNGIALLVGIVCFGLLFWPVEGLAQKDPGARVGAIQAGGPILGLSPEDEKLFWASWQRFKEVVSVSGTLERGVGLGPTFNGNSCSQCHAQPAAGGSSPGPQSGQVHRIILVNQRLALASQGNPQIELASLDRLPGKAQIVPSFITPEGPVRVPRFIRNVDGSVDGEVHGIYTIAGRFDAPGCSLPQPNFAKEQARRNVVFRIPTPTFGDGFIEAIPDEELIENLRVTSNRRRSLRIGGRFNLSAEGGTIARFGWKAQNNSLLFFSAESFNVEMGVTNEGFPNKRSQLRGCTFNTLPEDKTRIQPRSNEPYEPSALASDLVNVASFMRLSAFPIATTHSSSELNGSRLFLQIGCGLCHSPTLKTGASGISSISEREIHPYSDFALHHMGPGLSDHISQGLAAGDEFRTAPLWGLGQRLFFLHDGRTTDLQIAIKQHESKTQRCAAREACRSEANTVVESYKRLSAAERQDILNFLRSL